MAALKEIAVIGTGALCFRISSNSARLTRRGARPHEEKIAEFTGEFLSAAQRCFELIDKDGGGTLSA